MGRLIVDTTPPYLNKSGLFMLSEQMLDRAVEVVLADIIKVAEFLAEFVDLCLKSGDQRLAVARRDVEVPGEGSKGFHVPEQPSHLVVAFAGGLNLVDH